MEVIKEEKLPKTLSSFIFYIIRKHLFFFSFCLILTFTFSLNKTILPAYFGNLVDIFSQFDSSRIQSWDALKIPVLKMGALIFFVLIAFNGFGLLMALYFPRIITEIRSIAIEYTQKYTHSFFVSNLPGNISQQIINLGDNIVLAMQLLMIELLPFLLSAILVLGIFFQIKTGIALVLVLWLFMHAAICYYYSKYLSLYSEEHSAAKNTLAGIIVDSITNYLAIKLFTRSQYEFEYINSYQAIEEQKAKNKLLNAEKFKFLLGICTLIGSGLGINGYAFYAWLYNELTLGQLVIVFTVSWNFTFMVWTTTLLITEFFSYIGIAKYSFRMLTYSPEILDSPHAKELIITDGKITFSHVNFCYDKEDDLYHDFNLIIPGKQKIGIIGGSGSGKSTFIQLLLRLIDPQQGFVSIDDQNIAEVTQESLRKNISIIPQEPILFHRTIMENIRYAKPDASNAEVIAATRIAQAHDFIENMPLKYESLVGERGMKLSGGQRQRIAISRAILKNAPIVIFDEGTSALDATTESYIQEMIHTLMKGQTVLVISHKINTLMQMDRILVLDHGKIIQDGSPAELMLISGAFKTMYESQQET